MTPPRAALKGAARVFLDFSTSDLARYQLMNQRALPDFQPTAEQLANDPGGTRWGRLLDRSIDMYAQEMGLPGLWREARHDACTTRGDISARTSTLDRSTAMRLASVAPDQIIARFARIAPGAGKGCRRAPARFFGILPGRATGDGLLTQEVPF